MTTDKAQRIIVLSAALVLVIGTTNSFVKNGKWPTGRFWLGTGFMVVALSALSEAEPDVAAPLSIAVLTTVILGEGDGLLSYIAIRGETDTKRRAPKKTSQDTTHTTGGPSTTPVAYPLRTNLAGTTIRFA